MVVEWSLNGSFADSRRVLGPAATPASGFTARVDLEGLPPGREIAYRVLFQDLDDLRSWSLPAPGRLRTPLAGRAGVRFAWSADTAGQGWGIDRERGGMRLYETIRRTRPDFFIHCGDTIYADGPLQELVTLDDGSEWRNLVTPAKSRVAESLDELRGNHLYNLEDENVRRFAAEVSQLVLWDDHEVRNNWFPGQTLEGDARYRTRSASLLAARARQAFLEHQPLRLAAADPERIYRSVPWGPSLEVFALDLRSYRGPNSANLQAEAGPETAILGRGQLEWLKARLVETRATWKVIASDMPLGLIVTDWPKRDSFEAVANADDGPPLGRELEIAELLSHLKRHRVRNVLWLTGDVHYCAAHHYSPERARFRDFDPFWEFVAGPLHAGTFGPNALDTSFGPERRFLGIPDGMKPNRPPSEGLQFFGSVQIDADSERLRVALHDLSGAELYGVDLDPEGARAI
jgi:alkaline phosphatase D